MEIWERDNAFEIQDSDSDKFLSTSSGVVAQPPKSSQARTPLAAHNRAVVNSSHEAVKDKVKSPAAANSSFDATEEMADIDARLNALQDFLKKAKAGY